MILIVATLGMSVFASAESTSITLLDSYFKGEYEGMFADVANSDDKVDEYGKDAIILFAEVIEAQEVDSYEYGVIVYPANETINGGNAKAFKARSIDELNKFGVAISNSGAFLNGDWKAKAFIKEKSAELTLANCILSENEIAFDSKVNPFAKTNTFNKSCDVYELANKDSVVIDFAENVDNTVGFDLTYSAEYKGAPIVLDGSTYTLALDSYTDEAVVETFTVTVSYSNGTENKSFTYEYNLALTDSTEFRLLNGDFESGLEGWVKVGNIGDVDTATHYWVGDEYSSEGYLFGMDGEKMFSAYAPGATESAVGTLTSSSFKVGGSGFITFKVGGMKDANYVYVDVVDAENDQILARYYNGNISDELGSDIRGCTLLEYKANLSAFDGKEVYLRFSDNADANYGLFFIDTIVTYYAEEPVSVQDATAVPYVVSGTVYDVFNGGFEMGDVQGWWNIGNAGAVTQADAFFSGVAYGKEGAFLYSGVEDFQAGNGREGNRGTLTSSVFEIAGTGYISFKLGGGGNSLCFVQVIDSTTNEILARYHQQQMNDAVLIQYVADLSSYIGRTARIQVVDYAENNWGCVSFDDVVTYYATEIPQGVTAIDIKGDLKYTIENGSFENGLEGWTMNITEAGAHNTLGWVLSSEIDRDWYTKNDDVKDGNNLFTFVTPEDVNCENTKGNLTSSTFSLKKGAFVSFKFGGAGGAQNHDVFIELCREDGSVIARFFNDAPGKVNTRMNAYYYQYNDVEINCFFRVVDNSTGDYGCFVIDDFRVNLDSAPEGFIQAIQ